MKKYRKNEIISGILFFIATISYLIGSSMRDSPDLVFYASLLEIVNVLSVFFIGIFLYPIISKKSKLVSKSYLASRIGESIMLLIPIILLLLFNNYYDYFFAIAMIILCVGSLMLTNLMFKKRMIPRLISIIGIIGYAGLLIWSIGTLAGFPLSELFFAPGAIFEIIFPIWLIAKGMR